jgi:membrane associated rhomboid family serine protease
MDNGIDYSKYSEAELVEMFGRLDPRYAPSKCAQLGAHLTALGYVVTQGDEEPGWAKPSAAKLLTLIGSPSPFESDVEFGTRTGPLGPAHNDLGFVGSGHFRTDGIYAYISGKAGARLGFISAPSQREVQIPARQIVNVESQGRLVRFEFGAGEEDAGAVTLQLPDASAVAALIAVLPKTQTKEFRPQIKTIVKFEADLIAQSPHTPVTVGLIAINALIFIATLFDGADWLHGDGKVLIAWGANFGPYTTAGDWWRLFTSLFLHAGIAHIFFNMWALASFGPLVERLYGSPHYLLLYVLAGILASLTSTAWHPAANSVGASGAIFGICGALLAAPLRVGQSFPADILRPVRSSAFVFLGWALYASFRSQGVDYAAHLGGFSAGFVLGLVTVPPTADREISRRFRALRRWLLLPTASVLLAGGLLWAQRSAASLNGDALYSHTAHWMVRHEHAINAEFNSALRLRNQDPAALDETLASKVIPFWVEATELLDRIKLPANSPNIAALDTIQSVARRRTEAFQLLDQGLRGNDLQAISRATQELRMIDQLAQGRSPSP